MDQTARHTFDAPIDQVWAMFCDQEAHVAKFDSMGHRNIDVLECTNDDNAFMIKIKRDVDVDLPGFAKKVLKPTNTVISIDNWRRNDDGSLSGDFVLDTIGAPVDIKGTTKVTSDGEKSVYEIAFSLKVNVPLIGGKIANWANDDANKQLDMEFAAGDTWLSSH
jgi:hypothetical protein